MHSYLKVNLKTGLDSLDCQLRLPEYFTESLSKKGTAFLFFLHKHFSNLIFRAVT